MGTRIADRCYLSDAALETGAVVQVELGEGEQVFLWQGARRGGFATRLAPETSCGDMRPSPEAVCAPDALLHAWLPSARASPVCSYRFRTRSCINVQEMMSYRTAVKRASQIRRL